MGCANSRLDNLPAVALCRDRCKFLDQALLSSHAFVDAHSAYAESLKTLGSALHRLFDQDGDGISCRSTDGDSLFSKIEDSKSSPPAPSFDHSPSSSNSDSQLRFPSDSEDEDSDKEFGSFTRVDQNYINREKTRTSPSGNLMFSNYDSARGQFPPPPPSSSSWDFLNFFDTYERYEPVFASNWDREGGGAEKVGTRTVAKKNRELVTEKDDAAKCESRAADKNTVAKRFDQSEKKNDSTTAGSTNKKLGVSDLMTEIKASFEKASESGNRISNSISCVQRIAFSKDTRTSFRGLSSTLKKLCVWEQKLYLEVKAEEKLRIILEKKCRQLKQLVEKKTDARKVDSVRTLIGNLSIKLKVSIQVVDRISITISKLRDEEFLAEITELIHGLLSMWKAMLDCHKHQSQVVTDAKSFDAAFNGKLDDVHLEAAIELKIELQNWQASFSNWIATQKDCIRALNGWLLRCLLYEPGPEETPNNDVWLPFSPARIGAPPVFVLCNQWSEIMDKFSVKEVSETMHGLISSVDQLLEQHTLDLQRMVLANKDMEKKIRSLDLGEQKMKTKKPNQAWKEKTVAVTAEALHKTSSLSGSDVQSGLKQIFSALARFSADSIKAYEELCAIMEENSQTREKQPGP